MARYLDMVRDTVATAREGVDVANEVIDTGQEIYELGEEVIDPFAAEDPGKMGRDPSGLQDPTTVIYDIGPDGMVSGGGGGVDFGTVAEALQNLPVGVVVGGLRMLPQAFQIARQLGEWAGLIGPTGGQATGMPVPASLQAGNLQVWAQQLSTEAPVLYEAIQLARAGVTDLSGFKRETVFAVRALYVYASGTWVAPYGCDPKDHCRERNNHVL